jgi:DNA-binding transcriptional regulator WhiA
MNFDEKKIIKELQKAVVKNTNSHMENSVKNFRCPVHGYEAKITSNSSNLKNLNWTVKACCEEFKDSVIQELKRKA